ncbi:MAG: FAD-dependent oxidoreductase, partial [Pseudomonadota bacterium]
MTTNPHADVYDLCVIGAGAAGLNALAVARDYLPKEARVALVDRRDAVGGMWVDTYDYVRLHQPYRMFTAADVRWRESHSRDYLADKDQVLAHLRDCLDACSDAYHLEKYFGYEFLSLSEEEFDDEWTAVIELCQKDSGNAQKIRAKRCIKAFGFRVPQNPPLEFSSNKVRSISPHREVFESAEFGTSEAPCFIVGGGKTAMDTAVNILNGNPGRQVSLLVGRGTVFLNREKTCGPGFKRWVGGQTTLDGFLALGTLFNGENHAEVMAFLKQNMSVQLDNSFENYFF